jgi:hypothetical protein
MSPVRLSDSEALASTGAATKPATVNSPFLLGHLVDDRSPFGARDMRVGAAASESLSRGIGTGQLGSLNDRKMFGLFRP